MYSEAILKLYKSGVDKYVNEDYRREKRVGKNTCNRPV